MKTVYKTSKSSRETIQNPPGEEITSPSIDEREHQSNGRSPDNDNSTKANTNGILTAVPFQPTPSDAFPRGEIVNEVLDLTDRDTSVALFGPIGVGKSFVARAVLDHDRTRTKFGEDRYFMYCGLTRSLKDFLARLSDTIHTDVTQLRFRLQSSRPLLLLLDGMDLILDPLTPESQEICAVIEEFSGYEHVCLVITGRTNPDIRGFHRVEVPTLTESGAQDIFYATCKLGRSPAVDTFVRGLDPDPLSIGLLANCVLKKNWDESTLLEAWDSDQVDVVRESYHRGLRDIVEPALRSPTVERLGATARDMLEVIATSPSGVEESELEKEFTGIEEVVDTLCNFSLVYRQDGVVNMPLPVRCYILEFAFIPAQTEEVIHWDDDCMASRVCMSFPFYLLSACFDTFQRSPHLH